MNMQSINSRQIAVMEAVKSFDQGASYSEINTALSQRHAERTIKRDLSDLTEYGYLSVSGGGRSTEYQVTPLGRLFLPVNANIYNGTDPDTRIGVLEKYQLTLWENWPKSLFSEEELKQLNEATTLYQERSTTQSPDLRHRELERFVIEMSWKSSKIEGNTYTLLDTELLLKEGIPSKTNTEEETRMILNHKQAFDFVLENVEAFKTDLSFGLIETLHQHLTKGLLHDQGLRTGVVGITGSRYRPLDNQHQLREAVDDLIKTIELTDDTFSKALTALLGISYLQPFTDGNKRTARLLTNGLLLANECAPLSYRDVDERTYRASLLTFYEQLSILPMKELFTAQYYFSTQQYNSIS